jgi:pyridoxamine 5'-phosphate oxidase
VVLRLGLGQREGAGAGIPFGGDAGLPPAPPRAPDPGTWDCPTDPERSADARAEALVGRQSQILHDRAGVDAALHGARARIAAEPDLGEPTWTRYGLVAGDIEFWQADPDRRHTRLRYHRAESATWSRTRLWP